MGALEIVACIHGARQSIITISRRFAASFDNDVMTVIGGYTDVNGANIVIDAFCV